MNIVGYTLRGRDIGKAMFRDEYAVPLCPGCGFRKERFPHNSNFSARSMRGDIGATYDGQKIVSEKFKNTCEALGYDGIDFLPFDKDPTHFHLLVSRQVKFDAKRAGTGFSNFCSSCGHYESVIGADPTHLLEEAPLGEGLYRTDLFFAHGNEKHPLIVVGLGTKDRLRAAGLRGMDFAPAFDSG